MPPRRTEVRKVSPKTAIKKSVKSATNMAKRSMASKSRAFSAPKKRKTGRRGAAPLEKFEGNPIIEPNTERSWESKATFNPGAMYEDGKVHLLYRAVGDDDMSVLGYAASDDGLNVTERHPHPAYAPKKKSEAREEHLPIIYGSGGGWNGGCEDPRITRIGDRVYMIYTAFDGWGSLRIALTSIAMADFQKKKWKWKDPALISPPGEIHKNWVLFPEKIRGKFAILHSISPRILIDYFDSLDELDGKYYIKSYRSDALQKNRWDSLVRGAGPPPIKTKDGWLLLYHAIDHRDPSRYKLGAMLLDLTDPTKVLHRSKAPFLEPDEPYENEGFKPGVVYSCGAVVVNGELYIYYGGSDSFVCVATANLEEFLRELKGARSPKMKRIVSVARTHAYR